MEKLSWISYLSGEDLKKLHAEGCALSRSLIRTDRGSLLEAQQLHVSSVDGRITYQCPACGRTLTKESREDRRLLQQNTQRVVLSQENDSFHKEGCKLSRENISLCNITFVAQDLIKLPTSVHFGHMFFEYMCPSCHEWVSVEKYAFDGRHGCH